jgi:hypothetical protein
MRMEYHDPAELELRPVLYLDLDDTLVSWADGTPQAAPGAREFLLWAVECFAVRWLTTWCPSGEMKPSLLADLASMLEIDVALIEHICGFDWDSTETKLNGIAWLEHAVLRRPFLWIEDEYGFGERERRFLAEHGFLGRYRHCNVTEDPAALEHLQAVLEREWKAGCHDWVGREGMRGELASTAGSPG